DRSDIDDAAIVARLHVRYDGAAAIEDAVDIDVDDLTPFLRWVFPCRRIGSGDGGTGDQDVDMSEGFHGLCRGLIHAGLVADVDRNAGRSLAELGRGSVPRLGIDIPERRIAALGHDALGNGEADARR